MMEETKKNKLESELDSITNFGKLLDFMMENCENYFKMLDKYNDFALYNEYKYKKVEPIAKRRKRSFNDMKEYLKIELIGETK